MHIPVKGKMLTIQQPGPGKSLEIVETEIPQPGPGEVLVKMYAAPINPSDLAYLTGTYTKVESYPTIPGIEGSGTVVATGSGLLAKRLKGKNVMCSSDGKGGTWSQYMVTAATKCIPLGNNISLEEGATMIVNPLTALVMMEIAHKSKAKAIINTASASTLGKMLVQLCKRNQLPLINIVRKTEQVEALQVLGAEYVLNSSNADFKEQLLKLAEKLHASLAFDAIGGEMTATLVEAVQNGGEVRVYGSLSKENPVFNNRQLIVNDKKITGLYLANYMRKAGLLKALELTGKVKKLVKSELRTTVNQSFSIHQVNEAIEVYQRNMGKGKMLIVFEA